METYLDEKGDAHQKPDGIRPVRRFSAYAIVQDEDGKFLMVQPTWNTLWEFPGGGIELDESIRDGVAREFLEETGYAIAVENQPICVSERNFFSLAHDTYYKSILLFYRGSVVAPPTAEWRMNAAVENEIAKIDWIDPATLTQGNTHPKGWPVIQMVRTHS